MDVGNLISGSCDFSKSCLNIGKFTVHILLKLGLENSEHYFASVWSCKVAQSCLTLCDPMNCSLPGFSIHEIFQASVLEWVAISLSRGSYHTRDRAHASCIVGRYFTLWASREASVWDEWSCAIVQAFFGIAFLWDWNENWPFPVLWPLLSFPNLLPYWVQHFHSIAF